MPYVKCSRCMLNYIPDTDQYCKVCLVDMGKLAANHLLEEMDEDMPLCPGCGANYLEEGETLCFACRAAHFKMDEKEEGTEKESEFNEEFPAAEEDEIDEPLDEAIDAPELSQELLNEEEEEEEEEEEADGYRETFSAEETEEEYPLEEDDEDDETDDDDEE